MSKAKNLINEIIQCPHDVAISSRRLASMMAEVLNECSNHRQISLFSGNGNVYMRNNVALGDGEYLYLMRKARRSHRFNGNESENIRGKRWTFCWQGGAIFFSENASGARMSGNHSMEFVLPEVECRIKRRSETVVARGSVIDVIKELSIEKRGDFFYINNGVRTKKLKEGMTVTAQFAIAVAAVSGKHADKASHPDYCRQCDREVMIKACFKVSFILIEDEVVTSISIE